MSLIQEGDIKDSLLHQHYFNGLVKGKTENTFVKTTFRLKYYKIVIVSISANL